MPQLKSKKKTTKPSSKSKVPYPVISVKVCEGADALTAEQAKKILGWEITVDKDEEELLKDKEGNRIVCRNNGCNRPFSLKLALLYSQEILRGRWKLNGETIIIGKNAQLLSAQHRLIGLVLAEQMFKADPTEYQEFWRKEPVIETLAVFGIDEDDATSNTLDTGKGRSLTDVIFRSKYFEDIATIKGRKRISNITSFAIKFLWSRTGVADAYSVKRTHAESLDFLAKHSTLLEYVKFIYDENAPKESSTIVTEGVAAGLMYLMSCSTSDFESYDSERDEAVLDFKNSKTANEFWATVMSGGRDATALRQAIVETSLSGGGTNAEQVAVMIKGWLLFLSGKKLTKANLTLSYHYDEEGLPHLNEDPVTGGIDHGEGIKEPDNIPTEEEVEEAKSKERKAKASKKRSKGEVEFEVGMEVSILDEEGEPWEGTIEEFDDDPNFMWINPLEGFAGHGQAYQINRSTVSLK